MKRQSINIYVSVLIIAALLFSFLTIYAFGEHDSRDFHVSAKSAALYQPQTDTFLFLKDADKQMPMASTTKIMTALVALEACELDEIVEIDDSAIGTEGSSAYLKQGDVLTVEELLYALLLQSANDAAVAIACYAGGDIDGFSELMNRKADELGLTSTHFSNPHGLDDKDHYTTARELSIIAAEALKNPTFRKITSTYKKTFTSEDRTRTYVNHNKLLNMYDGCVGVKTGYTTKSGRCLVGAAEKDGLTFVSVTLDAPNDWQDHSKLLDFGFNTLEKIILSTEYDHLYSIPVIDGEKASVKVGNTNRSEKIISKGEHRVDEYIKLIRYGIAPINRGDKLGEIIYTIDGVEVDRVPLVATETVKKKEKNKFLDLFRHKQ